MNVTGTRNPETLDGDDGVTNQADMIFGFGGDDRIFGLGGNDLILGGDGADIIDGGAGIDTASYADSSEGVSVYLHAWVTAGGDERGLGHGGTAEGDVLSNIENLVGSSHADDLHGNASANVLTGGDGDDWLYGGLGADRLYGSTGMDTASYDDSSEGVSVSLATGQGFGGTAEGDVLSDIDNLRGSQYDDVLEGNASGNAIEGRGGNDIIKAGGGADTIDGGEGIDTVGYADSSAGVNVSLATGQASGGTAEGDWLISIENLAGSGYNDFLEGNGSDNTLSGFGGRDIIKAGGGADTIEGGGGADTIDGGGGSDTASYADSNEGVRVNLVTGQGSGGTAEGDTLTSIENLLGSSYSDLLVGDATNNTIKAGRGIDLIEGGGGADTIDGGEGIDTAGYFNSSEGVRVSLVTGRGSGGDAQGDVLTNIEDLIGSAHNDTLTGNASDNTLSGFSGNDTVSGGGGADRLEGHDGNDTLDGGSQHDGLFGGTGADLLTGGADSDYFYFHTADSGRFSAGQADAITDFTDGERIYLQGSYTFAGAGDTTPGAGEYAVFWNADANGWMVSWNNGGTVHDVVVYGDNPLGDIWFFS